MKNISGYLSLAGFAATIPLANWLVGNVGSVCVPEGPCLIPVWPGIMAPSGVLVIGAAMVLRDAVHERLGAAWVLAAILAGALLSAFFAPPALIVASAVAFLFSELADMGVYAPLRRRNLILAVAASGLIGAAVDSALFLSLAFGSLDHWEGQVLGKLWAIVVAVPFLWTFRSVRAGV